jgi:hypothetical protein
MTDTKNEQALREVLKTLSVNRVAKIAGEYGILADLKPLDPEDVGEITKRFREIKYQKGCWKTLLTLPPDCEIKQVTCDSGQVEIYTGNFITPQIHKYSKGSCIKVCGGTVTLPEAGRTD